jgi:ribonuclease P protein component
MRKNLTKKDRLKKKADFLVIYNSPLRLSSKGVKIIASTNTLEISRLGVGVSKKFGNAVKRNKAKRQIREIFRTKRDQFPKGFDYLVLLYAGKWTTQLFENQIFNILNQIHNPKVKSKKDSGLTPPGSNTHV